MRSIEPKHIGILLFDEVEELDAVGPWEVLSWWTQKHPDDGYDVFFLSKDGGLVRCAKGLVVQSNHSYAIAPSMEALIYPGGRGTRAHLQDAAQLDWVRMQRVSTPLMTSVCTGSLVYAAAGILTGRPATTHWASLDHLAQLDPTIEVRTEERFVSPRLDFFAGFHVCHRKPPASTGTLGRSGRRSVIRGDVER
ncbi:MAG TPA: DJ-1/PfpI family protein [Acidothermaceae bacterium]